MKTNKKNLLNVVWMLAFLWALPARAQEVTTVNGYPVVDLTALSAFGSGYKKIQISRSNNSTGSTWDNAFTVCSSTATIDGSTGWRLPTLKELRLIFALHPQLVEKGGFTAFDANTYWSSTESSASGAWFVNFGTGNVTNLSKTNSRLVRCVRDLP